MVTIFFIVATIPIAYAQNTTTLFGKLVNETDPNLMISGLQVKLQTISSKGTISEKTTKVDKNGEFKFEGILIEDGDTHILSCDYHGVTYRIQTISLPIDTPIILSIYETGADLESILLTDDVLILGWVDEKQGILGALESINLFNTNKRSFISTLETPGSMNFLRFSLPPDYINLDVQSSLPNGRIVPVDKGFGLTTPVPPGDHELMFTYLIKYNGTSLSFERGFPLGADSFTILIPQDLATLSSKDLELTSSTEIGDTIFTRLRGQNISRGTKIIINVEGLPQPKNSLLFGDSPRPGMIALIAIFILFILVIIGTIGYMLIYKKLFRSSTNIQLTKYSSTQKLIASIAKLDIQFQQGSIDETQYKKNRWLLKNQLTQEITNIDERPIIKNIE